MSPPGESEVIPASVPGFTALTDAATRARSRTTRRWWSLTPRSSWPPQPNGGMASGRPARRPPPGGRLRRPLGDPADPADPDAPFAFALPSPERLADAVVPLGISEGMRVGVYAQQTPAWATRLWPLMRYFGLDAANVLDGGLRTWRTAGLPLQAGEVTRAPARLLPRPERLATGGDLEAIVRDGGSCLVSALPPEVSRGRARAPTRGRAGSPTASTSPWGVCWT
jgi:hypothetical protein